MRVESRGERLVDETSGAVAKSGSAPEVGFYGKLPSHGDFLSRRVVDEFVGVWDGWLQECMAASYEALEGTWLDVYLTSPVWCFVSAAGACGNRPMAGIMVPSVDKVGRYFPLTIVAELPPVWTPLDAAGALAGFFEAAERLVIDTLAADRVDFDSFDTAVQNLAQHLGPLRTGRELVLDSAAADMLADTSVGPWHMPIGSPPSLGAAVSQMASHRLAALYDPLSLWWTSGSEVVEPSCLMTKGLPSPDSFVALMDGAWQDRSWNSVPAHVELASAAEDTLVDDPTPPRFRSSAATHQGLVRTNNQDSYLERPDVGVWVVADGVGGHQEGDVASRMVCDALAELMPDGGFEQLLEGVGQRLHEVNDHLIRAGARPINPVVSGSTVVALLVRGTRSAVLWAGDSRVYRWRRGRMQQLTRDHSVAEAEGNQPGDESHAITRAIGGEETLALDQFRDRVRAGDRFLLCSDGLTRVLWESEIEEWLGHPDITAAAQGLVQATLDGGAPDNVTVVVVEAYADPVQG